MLRGRGGPHAHPGVVPPTTRQPNDLWTADFKGHFRTRDGVYCYPLTVADQHTRYLLGCQGLLSTKGQGVQPVFERLFREFGLPAANSSSASRKWTIESGPSTSATSFWPASMSATTSSAHERQQLSPMFPVTVTLLPIFPVAHTGSQIFGSQPGALRNPCQHAWSDLFFIVKGEHEIGPTRPGQRPMGARLTLYRPPDPQESCQHPSSTGARPRAHAAAKEMLRS